MEESLAVFSLYGFTPDEAWCPFCGTRRSLVFEHGTAVCGNKRCEYWGVEVSAGGKVAQHVVGAVTWDEWCA